MALVPSEREALEPYASYPGGPSEALRSHVVPLAGIREVLQGRALAGRPLISTG
jgi:hypothetical protein